MSFTRARVHEWGHFGARKEIGVTKLQESETQDAFHSRVDSRMGVSWLNSTCFSMWNPSFYYGTSLL